MGETAAVSTSDAVNPPPSAEDIQSIRALLNSSQNHLAFESAQHLLREPIGDAAIETQLRYLAALAAARGGAREVARGMLAALKSINIADTKLAADIESLAGRLAKDVAFDARDETTRHAAAKEAAASYLRADAIHPNVYAKINAASLAAIAGDEAAARGLAQTVLDALPPSPSDDHWVHATRGEAKLLLDDLAGATEAYTEARRLAGNRFGEIASMRRQLRMLDRVRPEASGLLATVPGPNVVAFSGHMIDAPNRATPRFPAYLEDAVKAAVEREIDALLPVIAYAQAANGSDMLFCEALLARGQEVNIVLPFGREDYVAQSVAPGGDDWLARFDPRVGKSQLSDLRNRRSLFGRRFAFSARVGVDPRPCNPARTIVYRSRRPCWWWPIPRRPVPQAAHSPPSQRGTNAATLTASLISKRFVMPHRRSARNLPRRQRPSLNPHRWQGVATSSPCCSPM